MQPPTLQREPLYRQIYRILESRIINNEINVGDTIPSEQALADSLEVHRSSVREALRLLEENGLATRKPGGKKLIVTSPDRKLLGSKISNTLFLEETTFMELYEGIRVIEKNITEVAAPKISQDILDRMEENLAKTETCENKPELLAELDWEFHELIAEGTYNRVLQMSRLGMIDLFYPALHHLIQNLNINERMLTAHTEIYKALRDHDVTRAVEWSQKHVDDFKRGYEIAGLDIHSKVIVYK